MYRTKLAERGAERVFLFFGSPRLRSIVVIGCWNLENNTKHDCHSAHVELAESDVEGGDELLFKNYGRLDSRRHGYKLNRPS